MSTHIIVLIEIEHIICAATLHCSSRRTIMYSLEVRNGLHDIKRGRREMGRDTSQGKLLLCRWAYPRCCKDGDCLADTERGRKAGRWSNETREEEPNMNQYKIMVIEDDPMIQSELQTLLSGNGYMTVAIKDFSTVIETVNEEKPHLILLDIKLPGENGFTLCSKIRTFSNVPIIFVTGCDTDMDELNSIMLGGDAFITKPYNTAILLAKITSLLKRTYSAEQSETLKWQGAVLHLENSTIEYANQQTELTKNEVKILYYLFKHAGNICPRNDIVNFLWDNQLYVDDNALSVNINRIREKLSAIGLNDFIRTKHRQGYML